MNRDILRQIAVIATFVMTLVVNGLATSLPLNGMTPEQISDMFQNFFTPPGYVFSIWGVIYLGLAAFTVYQALPTQRESPLLRRVGWLFVLSNFFNAGWIFVWHYLLFPVSLLLMLGILVILLVIYVTLSANKPAVSTVQRWMVHVPFSIYAAWICVATIANTTIFLQHLGFEGGGIPQPVWSAVMLLIGVGIASFVVYTRRDVAFAAVFAWAFAGIAVKYSDTQLVAYTAGVLAALVLVVALVGIIRPAGPPMTGDGWHPA